MPAWIFSKGYFYRIPSGEGFQIQGSPGNLVQVLDHQNAAVAVIHASEDCFVVIADKAPTVSSPSNDDE